MTIIELRKGEAVHFRADIKVQVLDVRAAYVVIGTEAPPHIPIVRPGAKDKRPKDRGSK